MNYESIEEVFIGRCMGDGCHRLEPMRPSGSALREETERPAYRIIEWLGWRDIDSANIDVSNDVI